jgi:hypothetical protein
MLTHIVFFKLHDPSEENSTAVVEKLQSMNGRIPQIRALEAGANIVPSARAYDVALITKFDSLSDMEAYQIHPYHHDEVLPFMRAHSSDIRAVDFLS